MESSVLYKQLSCQQIITTSVCVKVAVLKLKSATFRSLYKTEMRTE